MHRTAQSVSNICRFLSIWRSVSFVVLAINSAAACGRINVDILDSANDGGMNLQDTDNSALSTEIPWSDDVAVQTIDGASECSDVYSDALVCTGFENGIDLDTHNVRLGSLDIEDDNVFTGETALRATVSNSEDFANVTGFFPAMNSGTVHFRAYYFIPKGMITGLTKLAAFEADGPTSTLDEINIDFVVLPGGTFRIHLHQQPEGLDDFESGPNVVPEDTWFCLQGNVDISDTNGAVSLLIDGREEAAAQGVDTLSPGGISHADFGIGWTEALLSDVTIYVDNIVVDVEPIPCIDSKESRSQRNRSESFGS